MARINNLSSFLTDVADAIREKKGTQDQIPAENFDTEIKSIETGTKINNQDKDITKNGTYTADEGYTGLGTVIVNVPQTGDVPVKLFKTKEEMNNSTGNKEGDLAIVYRNQNTFDGIYIYKNNNWKLAPTQLTATSDYVYEKEFYGKNGVESGTLGTPDNSFADTTAKAVYEIQNQYENMEPRILTDTDKTINKNIYFIPVKRDGTPLLDTSNVTNMHSMFEACLNLTTIPLLDTSSVKNMYCMFSDCTNLTTIPELNTSNVTDMGRMFYGCKNLITIPLLDTSNVTYMNGMFSNCTNLTTIPELNTSNVTYMGNMFGNCSTLTDDSLNIIMQMCINATSYTNRKTLKYIGLSSNQANKCKTLSNYSAFTSAGWTTGY